MSIPSSYDESTIKEYMQNVLGNTAKKLGWVVSDGVFDEPANEVLLTLNENDFSFATDNKTIAKLRRVARYEVWRAAMYYTAHEASFSVGAPGTGQTNRSDIHRHCKSMFRLSEEEIEKYYPSLLEGDVADDYSATITKVVYTGDYD